MYLCSLIVCSSTLLCMHAMIDSEEMMVEEVSVRNIRQEIQRNEERMEELRKMVKPVPNYIKYMKDQEQKRHVVLHMEAEGVNDGVKALHRYIKEEMGKKEKVLDEVLLQTKDIRKSFESFEKIIEIKNEEINSLKTSLLETKQEVSNLKSLSNKIKKLERFLSDNEQELSQLKSNISKTSSDVAHLRCLESKVSRMEVASLSKEQEVVSGLLEWHQRLDNQQRQQKTCKICRKEAKMRYRRHRSQDR